MAFRVICVSLGDDKNYLPNECPILIAIGSIYQVIDIDFDGEYYELSEQKGVLYPSEFFARLSEIDETEYCTIKEKQSI